MRPNKPRRRATITEPVTLSIKRTAWQELPDKLLFETVA